MNPGLSQQLSEGGDNGLLTEGFEDGGEEGSGQKLLHLLQKMGVENILVVVCVWHHRMPGQFGTDTFRMVLDRAKDLLTSLHLKVLEAEKTESQIVKYQEPPQKPTKSKVQGRQSALQSAGFEVATKVYPATVIPDKAQFVSNA